MHVLTCHNYKSDNGSLQMVASNHLGTDFSARIEFTLTELVSGAALPPTPGKLAGALHYAVFPGGLRIRPTLCLAIAKCCGDAHPHMANATAAALELLHCASLVHDDLACFDNASIRRGKPAVHREFGEALAVLAGDSLIVLAFESVTRAGISCPDSLPGILLNVYAAIDCRRGLIAGQALELEPAVVLTQYHAAKTGALFEAAAVCGALAAGMDGEPWRDLGRKLGRAYQMADDMADVVASSACLGKPTGRDEILGRPSFFRKKSPAEAMAELQGLLFDALDCIPPGTDAAFREWLRAAINSLLADRLHWSLEQPALEYCGIEIQGAIPCTIP